METPNLKHFRKLIRKKIWNCKKMPPFECPFSAKHSVCVNFTAFSLPHFWSRLPFGSFASHTNQHHSQIAIVSAVSYESVGSVKNQEFTRVLRDKLSLWITGKCWQNGDETAGECTLWWGEKFKNAGITWIIRVEKNSPE